MKETRGVEKTAKVSQIKTRANKLPNFPRIFWHSTLLKESFGRLDYVLTWSIAAILKGNYFNRIFVEYLFSNIATRHAVEDDPVVSRSEYTVCRRSSEDRLGLKACENRDIL